MKPIGGYFELELGNTGAYHPGAVRLNSGRAGLEYLLSASRYEKVYLPYYTCDVLLQPVTRCGTAFEFYAVDEKLEPVFDFSAIGANEAFLYTNYFGLKDDYIDELSSRCANLIIDAAQAFYTRPAGNTDTFYSPRKFFGVPDGGYVYSKKDAGIPLVAGSSHEGFGHLLIRHEQGAEAGYGMFLENEARLDELPLQGMSELTARLLSAVPYDLVAAKRRANFSFLHERLSARNTLALSWNDDAVPMVYPFLTEDSSKRRKLIENKVFVAKYWPNVSAWAGKDAWETHLAENILPLPVDQRYGTDELSFILDLLK